MKTKFLKKPASSHLEAQPNLSQICNWGKEASHSPKEKSVQLQRKSNPVQNTNKLFKIFWGLPKPEFISDYE